jgi:hypothetical protein
MLMRSSIEGLERVGRVEFSRPAEAAEVAGVIHEPEAERRCGPTVAHASRNNRCPGAAHASQIVS